MFERSPTAICAVGGGRVVYVNGSALRLWRVATADEMVGRPAVDFFAGAPFDATGTDATEVAVSLPSHLVLRRGDTTTVEVDVAVLRIDPGIGGLNLLVIGAGDYSPTDAPDPEDRTAPISAVPTSIESRAPGRRSLYDVGRSIFAGRTGDRVTEGLDRLTEMVVAGVDEGIAIVDAQARILWANSAATRITGLGEGDALTSLPLRTEDDGDVFPYLLPTRGAWPDDGVSEPVTDAVPADLLCRFDRGGVATWLSVAWTPLRADSAGHAVVSVVDISERQSVAEKLLFAAGHDELTGLPGRSLLIERIATALDGRTAGRLGALMFIDLDRLKWVNDTHGHLAGDEVLRIFAERLCGSLRREDIIGRLGGDEFVVLVLGCHRANDVVTIADRLLRRLREPMVIDVDEVIDAPVMVSVGASIGIVTIDDADQRSPRRLLAEADSAMYRAKRAGRGRISPGQPLPR